MRQVQLSLRYPRSSEEILVHLTRQNRRVCDCVLQGMTSREIAQELGVSVRTVKGHLHIIFWKFGIHSGCKRARLVKILQELSREDRVPFPSAVHLRPTDKNIIRYVSEGLRNKQIAALVGMAEQSVKNYLHGIFDCIGCFNRVELTIWYHTHMCEF